MEKRLLIAVALSVIVMLVYPVFLAKISPPPAEQGEILTHSYETKDSYDENKIVIETETTDLPSLADIGRNVFSSAKYDINVSTIGASINNIVIKDGKKLDGGLVEKAFYKAGILAMDGNDPLAGFSLQPFEKKTDRAVFYARKNNIGIEKSIIFLKDKYALEARIKITNYSDTAQSLSFDVTTASNISSKEIYESRYIGADILDKAGKFKRLSGGNFKKNNRLYRDDIEWLALRNKYYSIIAKPLFSINGVFTDNIRGAPVAGFIVDDEKILPGETKLYQIVFYIGPTDIYELEKVDQSFGKALNFGIFTNISLVLLTVLNFFYRLFHSYGLAIILLTCCVSFLLFPLSLKSLKSMRKMQELQPHIEKIREEHKENPHKLNKEMMEVYRRYNVNPMGGCLPMVLQMPIFIALYQTLMRSVELKGANFLWIKDLSLQDEAFHLPVALPLLGSAINLLPILMIGAMIIQQKLSQVKTKTSQTDQQKMMAMMMPVIFGFIFYSLPAGLVLYWLINTLLTSFLQFFALRKA